MCACSPWPGCKGWGPISWLYNSEIYPTAVRGIATGIASFVNWTANFVVSVTFLEIQHGFKGLVEGELAAHGCELIQVELAVAVPILNSAVMDITYIRHRWRRVLLVRTHSPYQVEATFLWLREDRQHHAYARRQLRPYRCRLR